VNIRRAREEDVPAIADILDDATRFVKTLGHDQWRLPFPHDELRQRIANDELFVIEADGERVGTFTLLEDDPWFWGERPPDAVYLHKLAVRRAFAGRGIGADAVEWVDAEAARRGRAFIRLDCQRDLPGIRRYYERLGFVVVGEKTHETFAWALYERRVHDHGD
jgi:GNAT superfamily N-acetyltransferase